MPAVVRFDPFRDITTLRDEMNRLFTDFSSGSIGAFPPINLWTGEHSLVVTAELPGVSQSDLDLSIRDDTLTISGRRPAPSDDHATWYRRERNYGDFSRTIELPFRIDPERVQARLTNGVLEIELHNREWENAPRPVIATIEADQHREQQGDLLRTLIHMDDPDHRVYRGLTSDWFLPKNLAKLEDRVLKLNEKLAAHGSDYDKIVELDAELKVVQEERARTEEAWLELAERAGDD